MRIAYVLFDDFTLLDFAGLYDPLSRLRKLEYVTDLEWDICALEDTVSDAYGLKIRPDYRGIDLGNYDILVVPGGRGTRTHLEDAVFLAWLQTASRVPIKLAVCTGSLLLGAAGLLQGKNATTDRAEYDRLREYGANVVDDRIVDDKGVISSGAVAASIDLGLYLCEKLAGKEAREAVRKSMNYHPV
ncbi:MAG: DJ-1/PfpI family protein [Saprospiraceae bacterium]|nr:DJ-1/PfpI family protein [Saprospiraceae bacterium]